MQLKRYDAPLKIKSVSDSGAFSGYGSVFGNCDSHGDVVVPGAFQKSLARWKSDDAYPALLWQHQIKEPIGVYTEMHEDDHGLYVEGRLLIDDDPLARRAHAHMKANSLRGLSIGFNSVDEDYSEDDGAYLLKEIDLWEVSVVTFPSNNLARVADVKNALSAGSVPEAKQVEKLLRDAGFSRQQAKGFMSKGFSALRDAEITLNDLKNAFNFIN